MPSRRPFPGWRVADPAAPATNMEASWWSSKIDIDFSVWRTDGASYIFKPDTSGTVYLISDGLLPVSPGQRYLASATFLNNNMSVSESLFIVGVAFYDAAGAYIGIAKCDSYSLAYDSAIAAATVNKWANLGVHASVSDFAGAVYARTVIGRASGPGDTNTIWCDSADLVIEPAHQTATRVATDSFGSGGTNDVFMTAVGVNADGFFLDSVGRLICLVGGTYVITGEVETTLADGNSSQAVLRKGAWTGVSFSLSTFARGTEIHHRTGNTVRYSSVAAVERFAPGEMLVLGTQTTNSGSLANAKVTAVRVSA